MYKTLNLKKIYSIVLISSIIVLISSIIVLTGCPSKPVGSEMPKNAVASFNVVKGKLVILNSDGKVVKPTEKSMPDSAKLKFETTIKLFQVNPCYAQMCSAGSPCETVLISNGPCMGSN